MVNLLTLINVVVRSSTDQSSRPRLDARLLDSSNRLIWTLVMFMDSTNRSAHSGYSATKPIGTAPQGRVEPAGLHRVIDNIRPSVNTILTNTTIKISRGITCFNRSFFLFNISHLKSFYELIMGGGPPLALPLFPNVPAADRCASGLFCRPVAARRYSYARRASSPGGRHNGGSSTRHARSGPAG